MVALGSYRRASVPVRASCSRGVGYCVGITARCGLPGPRCGTAVRRCSIACMHRLRPRRKTALRPWPSMAAVTTTAERRRVPRRRCSGSSRAEIAPLPGPRTPPPLPRCFDCGLTAYHRRRCSRAHEPYCDATLPRCDGARRRVGRAVADSRDRSLLLPARSAPPFRSRDSGADHIEKAGAAAAAAGAPRDRILEVDGVEPCAGWSVAGRHPPDPVIPIASRRPTDGVTRHAAARTEPLRHTR